LLLCLPAFAPLPACLCSFSWLPLLVFLPPFARFLACLSSYSC
jgi:hypothetical protein